MDVITEGKAEEESTGLDEQREEGNTMEKEERPSTSALDPTTTTTRRNSDSGLLGVGTRTTPGGGRLERPLNNYQTTPQERRRRRKVQSDTAAIRWMQNMDHHDNNMSIRSQFNSTRQGRLSTRDFNFGVPTKEGAKEHVQETHGTHHWRARVLEVLHSNLVQYVMMGLLLLDIFILFTELFLLSTYPMCYTIERDAISCCPVDTSTTDGDETLRWLAGGEGGGHDDDDHHAAKLCDDMDGFYPMYDYPVGCDSHKWERVHKAEFALFILTMLILSSMFLELNIEMIVLTPKVFFKQFWFALDYVIIGVSLTLDVLFHSLHYDSFQYYIGLLVGIRLWRFVRIGHGIVALTSEATRAHYEHLLCYAEELEVLLKANQVELPPSSANVKRHEDFMALIQEGAHEEKGDEEEEEKKEKG